MGDLLIEITIALSYIAWVLFIALLLALVKVFDFVIEFYEEI